MSSLGFSLRSVTLSCWDKSLHSLYIMLLVLHVQAWRTEAILKYHCQLWSSPSPFGLANRHDHFYHLMIKSLNFWKLPLLLGLKSFLLLRDSLFMSMQSLSMSKLWPSQLSIVVMPERLWSENCSKMSGYLHWLIPAGLYVCVKPFCSKWESINTGSCISIICYRE